MQAAFLAVNIEHATMCNVRHRAKNVVNRAFQAQPQQPSKTDDPPLLRPALAIAGQRDTKAEYESNDVSGGEGGATEPGGPTPEPKPTEQPGQSDGGATVPSGPTPKLRQRASGTDPLKQPTLAQQTPLQPELQRQPQ